MAERPYNLLIDGCGDDDDDDDELLDTSTFA
jgi:hypothetical protein